MLQGVRFYVPALGAISLLGAWLLARVPRGQPLAAITTLTVAAVLFGLGGWAFHDMYQHPFGPLLQVVPGPGGTVELKPGPGIQIGGPRVPRPAAPAASSHIRPSAGSRLPSPGLAKQSCQRIESRAERRPRARILRSLHRRVQVLQSACGPATPDIYARRPARQCPVLPLLVRGIQVDDLASDRAGGALAAGLDEVAVLRGLAGRQPGGYFWHCVPSVRRCVHRVRSVRSGR
jgi:hypothetical protein